MAFQEKQLTQARENSTNAVSVYSPGASTTAIIKEIWLCNTTEAEAIYSLFCDDDGTTYNESTALVWEEALEAKGSYRIPCYIPMNDAAGNFAYKISVASAITISLFGAEIT